MSRDYAPRKPVVMEFTMRFEMLMPDDSTPEEAEFQFGESSWCFDNLLDDLAKALARPEIMGGEGCVLCKHVVETRYAGRPQDFPVSYRVVGMEKGSA